MARCLRWSTPLALCLLLGACGSEIEPAGGRLEATGPRVAADSAFVAAADVWHAERLARLTRPDGWLSLVGLAALPEAGEVTVGSAADAEVRLPEGAPLRLGTLRIAGGAVRFVPAAEADVRLAGAEGQSESQGEAARVAGPLDLVTDAAGEPTVLAAGSLRLHAIERDGRLFLRIRDTESGLRRTFAGIERFPVDPGWRVEARLVAVPGDTTVEVPNVLGGTTREPSPGVLEFELAGRTCRLRPTGAAGESLFLVFADQTSGLTTYGGGRFLSAEAPDERGRVILDFNRATNPPCAFTPYATCPLPPPGNLLPVAVEAGEKAWGDPAGAHGGPESPAGAAPRGRSAA